MLTQNSKVKNQKHMVKVKSFIVFNFALSPCGRSTAGTTDLTFDF